MDEIRSKNSVKDRVDAKCVWRGKFEHIPHVGEYVIIHDGWASEPVLEIHHDMFAGSILVFIHPDLRDEYPEVK